MRHKGKASSVQAYPAADVYDGGLLVRVSAKLGEASQESSWLVSFDVDPTLALLLASRVETASRECLEARRGWTADDRERPGPGLESDVAKARTALANAGIEPGDIVTMAVAAARLIEERTEQ